jgi:hypothetical protein
VAGGQAAEETVSAGVDDPSGPLRAIESL